MMCVSRLYTTAQNFLTAEKNKKQKLFRDYVIPLMQSMRSQIHKLPNVNDDIRCIREVRCLYYIELTQLLIGESQEATLIIGHDLMKHRFGDRAVKYGIYADMLYRLGVICENTSRVKHAKAFYALALESVEKAEDISDEIKKEKLELTKSNLQKVTLE